jgi:hypothetical protein
MKLLKILFLAFLFLPKIKAQDSKNEAFSFIAFGDMPYNLPQDYVRFENVIKTINDQKSAFTVNVGDIKASESPCSEEVYNKTISYYQNFAKPMIYVPGDNEWTDCGKKEAGAYDPEERLAMIRKLFYKDSKSFGKEKINLNSQSQNTEYKTFVENNRWEYGNISFATIHIVGSNNNFLSSSTNNNKEFYEREKADLAWMEEIFKNAKDKNHSAIVIVIHADMFLGSKDLREASGFNRVKKKLQDLVIDFKKPVLLINGDSHIFLIDKPFYDNTKTKKSTTNFTRLQVQGDANMHAVKININPSSNSIFSFEELIVAGN